MKHNIEASTPCAHPWCFENDEKALALSITIEIRLDFLEDAQRGQFDRVGEQVAAKLHELYREWQREKRTC